ncbi:hypothetical protein ES703_24397 [subsurface metagenome]
MIIKKIRERIKQVIDGIKFFVVKTDKDSSIDFIFSNSCAKISQNREEFEKLIHIFRNLDPSRILEIGTYKGGSLYVFSRQKKDMEIVSVDYPMKGERLKWFKYLMIKNIPTKKQKLHLLKMNSHEPGILKKVKDIFKGRKIDFLFIDADHSYAGVKSDFNMYSPLVRKGGIIGLHDIASKKGVIKFWNEIKREYNSEEILAANKNDWIGIGVIIK